MRPVSSSSEYLFKYARFLHSGKAMEDFCREEGIDYLEFLDFARRWDDRYGEGMVQTCMKQTEWHTEADMQYEVRPSRAQALFGRVMPVPDERDCRSVRRFPDNPALMAELDTARPGSTVRRAAITFPSGVRLELGEATIRSLILTVILYEDFDTWAGK